MRRHHKVFQSHQIAERLWNCATDMDGNPDPPGAEPRMALEEDPKADGWLAMAEREERELQEQDHCQGVSRKEAREDDRGAKEDHSSEDDIAGGQAAGGHSNLACPQESKAVPMLLHDTRRSSVQEPAENNNNSDCVTEMVSEVTGDGEDTTLSDYVTDEDQDLSPLLNEHDLSLASNVDQVEEGRLQVEEGRLQVEEGRLQVEEGRLHVEEGQLQASQVPVQVLRVLVKTEKEEKEEKQQHLFKTYQETFEKVRKSSKFAKNGKKSENLLPFYHNMENVVAAGMQTQVRDVSGQAGAKYKQTDGCPVKKEVRSLSDRGWPEDEVAEWIRKAEKSVMIKTQHTMTDFFKPKEKLPAFEVVKVPIVVEDTLQKTNTGDQPGKDAMKVNSKEASNIGKLAEYLRVSKSNIIQDKIKKEDPLNLLSRGLAEELKDLRDTEKINKQLWKWKKSKFEASKQALEDEETKLKEILEKLAALNCADIENPEAGQSLLENMETVSDNVLKIKEITAEVSKRLCTTRTRAKEWKRFLGRRVSSGASRDPDVSLKASNFGVSWSKCLEDVQEEFHTQANLNTTRMRDKQRENLVMGFSKDFFEKVTRLFKYSKICGSEYVTFKEVVTVTSIPSSTARKAVAAIFAKLPVAKLKFHGKNALINTELMNENPDLIIKLCAMHHMGPSKILGKDTSGHSHLGKKSKDKKKNQYHVKYPEVVEKVRQIVETGLKDHGGVEADLRRRSELGMAGVTIPQILEKLKDMMPVGVKMPSAYTVRHWMAAPSQGRKCSAAYKSLIPARVPSKVNKRPIGNIHNADSHQCASSVKLFREFGQKHSDEIRTWSNDDKAKISIGGSIQHRLSSLPIYPEITEPNFFDHEKRSGLLVEDSGYLIIGETPRSEECHARTENTEEQEEEVGVIREDMSEDSETSEDEEFSEEEEDLGENTTTEKEELLENVEKAEERLTCACVNFLKEILNTNVLDEICGEQLLVAGGVGEPHTLEESIARDLETADAAEKGIVIASEKETVTAEEKEAAKAAENENVKAGEKEPVESAENDTVEAAEKETVKAGEKETVKAAEKETAKAAEKETAKAAEKETAKAAEKETAEAAEKETAKAAEKETAKAAEKEDDSDDSTDFDWDLLVYKKRKTAPRSMELDSDDSSDDEKSVAKKPRTERKQTPDSDVEIEAENVSIIDNNETNTTNESETEKETIVDNNENRVPTGTKGKVKRKSKTIEKMVLDKNNRSRFSTPSTGDFYEFFSSKEHSPSSIAEHVNEMSVVRKIQSTKTGQNKTTEIHIVDQGADWDFHAAITRHFLWRYFTRNNLDLLILAAYAPGESRFNPCERMWGYLSRMRAGMSLPENLLDEPENKRTDLDRKELVYNQAIRLLTAHDSLLPGVNHRKITAVPVFVDSKDEVQVDGKKYDLNKIDKRNFQAERKLVNSNTLLLNVQKKNKKLAKAMGQMRRHMEVRSHCIVFRKCVKSLDEKVCKMCQKKPHQMSKELVADLPKREQGGGALFWDISEDPLNKGHYKTLLQTLEEKAKTFNPDAFVSNSFGRCKFDNCSFSFKSVAESERHYKHDHGCTARDSQAPGGYSCEFVNEEDQTVCGAYFDTRNKRDVHKREQGHIKKRVIA